MTNATTTDTYGETCFDRFRRATRTALIAHRAAGGKSETHRRRTDDGRTETLVVADLNDGLGRRVCVAVYSG